MFKSIDIKNYKSVVDVKIELGRVNVFIGENGCGKTNILEAIALASAAADNKLDYEFLSSRGVRITDSKLMKSAFDAKSTEKNINIRIVDTNHRFLNYAIDYFGRNLSVHTSSSESEALLKGKHPDFPDANTDILGYLDNLLKDNEILEILADNKGSTSKKSKRKNLVISQNKQEELKLVVDSLKEKIDYLKNTLPIEAKAAEKLSKDFFFSNFLIYAPENFFLRRFEEEVQIKPLGIRGEGLFKHLVELIKEDEIFLQELSKHLKLINWFEKLDIPVDLSFTESRLNIKDRFLKEVVEYFDQRSANEGFLYLLFYFTLFLSKETPNFFAVDNIDTSLNPKLCSKLIDSLVKLSSKNSKQVILTTHNPSVLDGLDISDDEQRLFVIFRNADGQTKVKRVNPPKEIAGVEPIRLSEAFIRGYLGGLPKNF